MPVGGKKFHRAILREDGVPCAEFLPTHSLDAPRILQTQEELERDIHLNDLRIEGDGSSGEEERRALREVELLPARVVRTDAKRAGKEPPRKMKAPPPRSARHHRN